MHRTPPCRQSVSVRPLRVIHPPFGVAGEHNAPGLDSVRQSSFFAFQWFIRSETGGPSLGARRRRFDLAGLLTGSRSEAFPIPKDQWPRYSERLRSFTAAGLSGICTRFPFHSLPARGVGNQICTQRYAIIPKNKPPKRNFCSEPPPRALEGRFAANARMPDLHTSRRLLIFGSG